MRRALRRNVRTTLTLALALGIIGIAGVASAALVCIELDDQVPATPPLLYRLNMTLPGNNTATFVGTATQGLATRVSTGGGALIGGQFEISLQGSDIVTPSASGGTPLLVTHITHILLNGPAYSSGIFEAVHVRIPEPGQAQGETTSLSDGTAAVVTCPPQGDQN